MCGQAIARHNVESRPWQHHHPGGARLSIARSQRLEGVSGRRGRPDTFAMAVRRQSDDVQIGGHDLIEVELWFDVPLGATVTGLRVEGDRDVTGFMSRSIVPHAPNGVLLPMIPAG